MNTRIKGALGENIACEYLGREKFTVIARNYRKKWGEIDVIDKKDKVLHFFEVKSVTGPMRASGWRPEENVHSFKTKQISRMIKTYFMENHLEQDAEFHFHVLCVFMDNDTRTARVKWIKDVIL